MAACPRNTFGNRTPNPLEEEARTALEAVLPGGLSDTEWQRARTNLLELAKLVRGWELHRKRAR
jgi:hypothetical protein